jgi:hypothetical protein
MRKTLLALSVLVVACNDVPPLTKSTTPGEVTGGGGGGGALSCEFLEKNADQAVMKVSNASGIDRYVHGAAFKNPAPVLDNITQELYSSTSNVRVRAGYFTIFMVAGPGCFVEYHCSGASYPSREAWRYGLPDGPGLLAAKVVNEPGCAPYKRPTPRPSPTPCEGESGCEPTPDPTPEPTPTPIDPNCHKYPDRCQSVSR